MKDGTETLNLNLTVNSLARLFDELGYPNPDDPYGDWGPIGPVVSDINWAALNPQPLPPKWVVEFVKRLAFYANALPHKLPGPQPWKGKPAPTPEPWKAALLARVEIDRIVGLAQMVETVDGERGRGMVSHRLNELVDEWCGTPVPRPKWPLPWPFPFRFRDEDLRIGPADLLVMGMQFHKAAEALGDSALAADFSNTANRLTQTGLERLVDGAHR